jgi:hypothetical protein
LAAEKSSDEKLNAAGIRSVTDSFGGHYEWIDPGAHQGEDVDAATDKALGHAVGATITKSGLFRGKVHAPEEIIPQAIASRGPGPIARALDALYGVTTGNRESSISAGLHSVEVHLHTSNDFSGMRVSSAIDVDKLMREIDRRIESGSVAAVKKAIGQGRT